MTVSGCHIWALLGLLMTAGYSQAAAVRIAPLEALTSAIQYSAPAEVITYDHTVLSAQISGVIEQISVRVGEQVKQGQHLVTLDCRDYRLAQAQAAAALEAYTPQLTLARVQLARAEKLVSTRSAAKELRDQRQAELENLQAGQKGARVALENAQLAVSRCVLAAPFDGAVTARLATEGSLATPGAPLLQLLRSAALEVRAHLAPRQTASLVQSPVLSYEDETGRYTVQLRALLPLLKERTRTREARLLFSDRQALPGSSGRLLWQAPQLRVPTGLVVRRENQLGLMLYNNGRAHFHPLPDALEGQAAAVQLPPETLVIIEGQHAVRDGEAVERAD